MLKLNGLELIKLINVKMPITTVSLASLPCIGQRPQPLGTKLYFTGKTFALDSSNGWGIVSSNLV